MISRQQVKVKVPKKNIVLSFKKACEMQGASMTLVINHVKTLLSS
jgi:hypothetical protein